MSTSIFKLLTSIIKQQSSLNAPLTFTAIEPGVEIALTDNTNSNVLQYRRDSSASWQPYDGTPIILENQGDYVQFQNTDEEWLNTYKERN